jgi:hypothetical protein
VQKRVAGSSGLVLPQRDRRPASTAPYAGAYRFGSCFQFEHRQAGSRQRGGEFMRCDAPPRRYVAPTSVPATPAEIPVAAAYPPPSSSNANSLCCAVSATSPELHAATPADFDPNGFRSSSPITPGMQSVSAMCRNGVAGSSGEYLTACAANRRGAGRRSAGS